MFLESNHSTSPFSTFLFPNENILRMISSKDCKYLSTYDFSDLMLNICKKKKKKNQWVQCQIHLWNKAVAEVSSLRGRLLNNIPASK